MQVIAKAYDNPIPGFKTPTVGNLRLWEALPVEEFDLSAFNEGKYDKVSRLSKRQSLWPVSREKRRPSATDSCMALVSLVSDWALACSEAGARSQCHSAARRSLTQPCA